MVDVYIAGAGDGCELYQAKVAMFLRDNMPNVRIMNHCGGGNFKRQLRRADKLEAKVAVILGSEEISTNSVTIKDLLNQDTEQCSCDLAQAPAKILQILGL